MVRPAPAALAALLALAPLASGDAAFTPDAPARMAGQTSAPAAGRAVYALDAAHTTVGFRIRHMGVAYVEGEFDGFEGRIAFDPADLAATTVTATVQMTSVDTDIEARDRHLRSGDFFDVEAHPTMTFTSTAALPTGPTTLRLAGDLTMKGVTRPVVFDVEAAGPIVDPRAGSRVGFHATAEIDRRDFGVTWGQTLPGGVPSLGHMVKLVLDVEATPAG